MRLWLSFFLYNLCLITVVWPFLVVVWSQLFNFERMCVYVVIILVTVSCILIDYLASLCCCCLFCESCYFSLHFHRKLHRLHGTTISSVMLTLKNANGPNPTYVRSLFSELYLNCQLPSQVESPWLIRVVRFESNKIRNWSRQVLEGVQTYWIRIG